MNIQKTTMNQLNPAPYNPRKRLKPGDAEYEKLKRSIKEFGVVEPIVFNSATGNIVGGHQRYYGVEASAGLISRITDKIMPQVVDGRTGRWRRCTRSCTFDGIVFKVRKDSKVINKCLYSVLGIRMDGRAWRYWVCGCQGPRSIGLCLPEAHHRPISTE